MKKKMKAAQLHSIGKRLRLNYIRMPTIGSEDVLVDIKASGICHSDLNYCYGRSPVGKLPIVLGHEIAGIIFQIGKKVKLSKVSVINRINKLEKNKIVRKFITLVNYRKLGYTNYHDN